ncbi:hypothetical protein N5C66_29940 [Rhizobium pusense]|uniref:hypothetical protein n=1 Tax=Agrobacterium pusense TaxID=648995 RepID=UPI000D1A6C80|nr:hypothetical protein [Agrobacterium pusense]MDH0913074.1 hypothetical protein [Agrobacterium pusense]MDH1099335.1 hypothetical protein [Agrobacterium pusense]MDH1115903.1 hypothetical protein [Agrobacterium pusense]MDH2197627.1 hypothetical protein [Agrobacterium pusense]
MISVSCQPYYEHADVRARHLKLLPLLLPYFASRAWLQEFPATMPFQISLLRTAFFKYLLTMNEPLIRVSGHDAKAFKRVSPW